MPTISPVILQAIHDIGGWTFASVILAAGLLAMVKGLVVPRFLYDEQKDRADRAVESHEKTLATIDKLAASLDLLTSALIAGRRIGDSHE